MDQLSRTAALFADKSFWIPTKQSLFYWKTSWLTNAALIFSKINGNSSQKLRSHYFITRPLNFIYRLNANTAETNPSESNRNFWSNVPLGLVFCSTLHKKAAFRQLFSSPRPTTPSAGNDARSSDLCCRFGGEIRERCHLKRRWPVTTPVSFLRGQRQQCDLAEPGGTRWYFVHLWHFFRNDGVHVWSAFVCSCSRSFRANEHALLERKDWRSRVRVQSDDLLWTTGFQKLQQ